MNALPLLAIGGGVLLFSMGGKKKKSEKERLLSELAEATGNADFDPKSRDVEQIVNELSLLLGTKPGEWTPALADAIRHMIQEFRADKAL